MLSVNLKYLALLFLIIILRLSARDCELVEGEHIGPARVAATVSFTEGVVLERPPEALIMEQALNKLGFEFSDYRTTLQRALKDINSDS